MPAPTYTPLPPAPTRKVPATFADLGDAFVAALPTFGSQLNALAVFSGAAADAAAASEVTATNSKNTAVGAAASAAASAASALAAPGTSATSTTSLTIGTGAKALTVQVGKAFAVGQPVVIAATAAPGTTWMAGSIETYNAGTGAMTVNVLMTRGSGTLASWSVALSAPVGEQFLTVDRLGAASVAGVLDWNDVTNTCPGSGPTLLQGSASNGPTPGAGDYFHAFNLEFGAAKTGTGNVTQLAIPYGVNVSQSIYMRGRFSGAWTPWRLVGGNESVLPINTATTAVQGRTYVLLASLTLTLPAAPIAGDWVRVSNRSGTTTCVIGRNGQNIMGLAEDMRLSLPHVGFRLVFVDATRGWVLV